MDALTRGLEAITGSAAEAQAQLARLREVAKLPGLGFREAIEGSIRLQSVGFNAQVAERALKVFANAVAFTGGGKSELDRITVQLSQMSGKSKILAQDMRPIIEAAPAVGKALKEAFGTVDTEQLSKLGLTNAQFLDKLLTQLEKLPPAANGAKNAMENFGDTFDVALSTIGGPLLDPLTKALDAITPMMGEAAQQIGQFLNNIPQLANTLISSLPDSFKNSFGVIFGIVQSVGSQIVGWFTENFPLIKQTVQTILSAIGDFWANWGGTIKTIVSTAMNAILGVIKIVMQIINGDWAGAWETLKGIVLNVLNNLPAIIKGVLSFAVQAALALGKAIVKAIWEGIKAAPGLIVDALKALLSDVWELAKWAFQQAIEIGKAIVRGIWEGIKSLWSWLTSGMGDVMKDLVQKAKDKAEIKSPSRVFFRIGQEITRGLAHGIIDRIPEAEGAISELLASIAKKFTTRQRTVGTQPVDDAQKAIADAIAHQADVLKELAGGETALEAINKLLANPNVAAMVDERTAALLRFNAVLEDTLKLTRERMVGLPPEMRATGDETRERSIGIPMDDRADPSATRPRRVFDDPVAIARQRAGEIADDLSSILGGAFDDLLDKGWRGFLDGMLNSAKRVFSAIAEELLNQLLRSLLGANQQGKAGGLVGLLSGIFGGAGGGGGFGGFLKGILGGLFAGSDGFFGMGNTVSALDQQFAGMPLIPGFAKGGDYQPGWKIVGERGPELDYSPYPGHVFSNDDTKKMLGGDNHYHIHVNVPPNRAGAYMQPRDRKALAQDIVNALTI